MANKLMYIPNDNTQNYHSCRLQLVVDTQLNKSTNQNSVKVVKQTKKKMLSKNFGDQCNKQAIVPSLRGSQAPGKQT